MAKFFVKICEGRADGPAMFAGHWEARSADAARDAAIDAFMKPLPPEDCADPAIAAFEARCAAKRLVPFVAVARRSNAKGA